MRYRRLHPFAAPAFAVVHPEQRARAVTLDVPGYMQVRNYSCGFASALMVARYFQRQMPAVEIYRLLGTNVGGTRQTALVRTLRELGLSAGVRYDMNFELLSRAIDSGKPLIGYLVDDEHWLVIYGYALSPQRVYVADPRPGQTCEQAWENYGPRLGGFAIVCSDRDSRTESDEPASHATSLSAPADVSRGIQLDLPFLE